MTVTIAANTASIATMTTATHFAQHTSQEVVMAGKVVHQQSCLWVGIQQLVSRAAEEPAVWIERCLDQFRHELTEDAATVNSRLVKPGKVHQSNLHPKLQVRLCTTIVFIHGDAAGSTGPPTILVGWATMHLAPPITDLHVR